MLNVFQLADNDQSIYYLGQIFGNVGFSLSGTGPALLSQLFKVFNTIMLVVAVIIVTYVSVVGVMKTAAEGEVLGKGWSTLWVPLRTVFGIAALMPTTTGYCAAQVIIMWFIVQGIGAADTVWSAALKYFAAGGGVMSASVPKPTDITGQGANIWTQIMQNLICQSVVTKFYQNKADAVATTQLQPQTSGAPIVYTFGNASSGTPGAAAECGTLTLPVDGTMYQVTYNGQVINGPAGVPITFPDGGPTVTPPTESGGVTMVQTGFPGRQAGLLQAYQTALPTLETIADYYVKQIIDDPNCWDPCPNPGSSCQYFDKWNGMSNMQDKCFFGPTAQGTDMGSIAWNAVLSMSGSNFLMDVTKLFAGEANNYAVAKVQATTSTVSGTSMSAVDSMYQKAQVNGWIYAGAYYYMLAGTSNSLQDTYTGFLNASIIKLFATDGPDFKEGSVVNDPQKIIMQYAPYLTKQASNALATTLGTGGGLSVGSEGAGPDTPSGVIAGSTKSTENQWRNAIAPGGGNPLARMQSFGHNVLLAADILCITFFSVSVIAGLAAGNIVELGFSVNPFYQAVYQGLNMLTTAVFFLVAYMITIGGILGVYMPLIPYVLFSLGAISWMIIVVEAMVAGPIIAIGVLSPGGQGSEIFGRADPAVFMTLSIMLRPTLMLFGMFAAMLLAGVVVNFINSAFFNVVNSFNPSGFNGMFETFIYIIAYCGLVITALNKCFELIYHVPDRVLHWIGQQGGSTAADQQALGEIKGKVSAGGEAGAGAGRGVGGRAASEAATRSDMSKSGSLGKGDRESELENKRKNARGGGPEVS